MAGPDAVAQIAPKQNAAPQLPQAPALASLVKEFFASNPKLFESTKTSTGTERFDEFNDKAGLRKLFSIKAERSSELQPNIYATDFTHADGRKERGLVIEMRQVDGHECGALTISGEGKILYSALNSRASDQLVDAMLAFGERNGARILAGKEDGKIQKPLFEALQKQLSPLLKPGEKLSGQVQQGAHYDETGEIRDTLFLNVEIEKLGTHGYLGAGKPLAQLHVDNKTGKVLGVMIGDESGRFMPSE